MGVETGRYIACGVVMERKCQRRGREGDTTSLSIPKEMSGLELRGKSSLHCDVVGCQWANGEVL